MSQFFEDLFQSIFTPGPTPTLLIATNVAFAGLQLVFFLLLIATYSIHFFILSFLCGGLWVAINWFAREIQTAKEIEEQQKNEKKRTLKREGTGSADDSGTETEDAATSGGAKVVKSATLESNEGVVRRRSLAGSGTDSEWDKVESEISAEE